VKKVAGYTVTAQEADNPDAQTSYVVTRDADGTGLGAFAGEDEILAVIEKDKAFLAEAEQPADGDVSATKKKAGSK
jgi:hypothetical protein